MCFPRTISDFRELFECYGWTFDRLIDRVIYEGRAGADRFIQNYGVKLKIFLKAEDG